MNESIVILTRQNSRYGLTILELLLDRGIRPTGIIVQEWGAKQRWKRLEYYGRKYGWTTAIFHILIGALDSRFLAPRTPKKKPSLEYLAHRESIPTFRVPTLNGETTQALLDRLRPEVILLGGVGIVAKRLLRTAKRGTLNAHPGIVPRYRGNHVVRWALLAGDEIGVTVHLVDEGVDTGSILTIESIEIPSSPSLSSIEKHTDKKRAEHLVASCMRYLKGELVPRQQLLGAQFPQYSLMPAPELIRTYRVLWKREREAQSTGTKATAE